MKKNKKNVTPFMKYLAIVLFLMTSLTLSLFKFIDVLPGKYFWVLCVLLFLFMFLFLCLIFSKKQKKRIIGTIFSIFYIILLVLAIVYEVNTIDFLKKLGFKNYKTENYSVLVLNTQEYSKIGELNKKTIGSLTFSTDGLKHAKEKLENKISPEFVIYEDVGKLKTSFLNQEVEAILLEDSILAILNEEDEEFARSYKVIFDFSIDIETSDITKKVDITKESFNIYISGIDTYGSVSSVSRSDVNMVLTINPNTNQILITSIPRDYYVTLHSKSAKDKLTHAGIYGIEESVTTIEDLLDIKINYYIKLNFTSLIKIVDTLGGVNVYSKYDFTSRDGYHYNTGYNNVNGEEALSFVRERKAFREGDRMRIENQAEMIKALVNKVTTPSILTKYNSLLDVLSKTFITNLDMESITEFIKMQLNENPSWEVTNQSLDGSDALEYTYSYSGSKLYVMIPDEKTVINAKYKLKEVFGN